MAINRQQALKRLQKLAIRVQEHLDKIAATPGHSSQAHWQSEVRNWLQQMKEQLPHVGKKTASEWQARIKSFPETLQQ